MDQLCRLLENTWDCLDVFEVSKATQKRLKKNGVKKDSLAKISKIFGEKALKWKVFKFFLIREHFREDFD